MNRHSMLRKILKGYRIIEKEKNFYKYRALLNSLVKLKLTRIEIDRTPLYVDGNPEITELTIRTYLTRRLSRKFYRIICANQYDDSIKANYPLPEEWRTKIIEAGYDIYGIWAKLSWWLYIFYSFASNVIRDLVIIVKITTLKNNSQEKEPYAYFVDMTERTLPREVDNCGEQEGKELNCTAPLWFIKSETALRDCRIVGHGIELQDYKIGGISIRNYSEPWFQLRGIKGIAKLWWWWTGFILIAGMDMLRGRWWKALILSEATKASIVSLTDKSDLAVYYAIPYSGTDYRPLWTIAAGQKGIDVALYFYSANEEPASKFGARDTINSNLALWDKIYVWTEMQKQKLVRSSEMQKNSIKVVGPIWYQDCSKNIALGGKVGSKRTVGIFGLAPLKRSVHLSTSTYGDWFAEHPDLYIRFCTEAIKTLTRYSLVPVFKLKRSEEVYSKWASREIINLHSSIKSDKRLVVLDSDISPFRVAEKLDFMVSMPFTSTALIGRASSWRSVYYDPTGWIEKDDPSASGIQVISGMDELEQWAQQLSVYR